MHVVCVRVYLAEPGESETAHHSLSYHHHSTTMSLLQDLLRTQTLDSLDKALSSGRTTPDDDDELINVVSTMLILFLNDQSARPHLTDIFKDVVTGQPRKIPSRLTPRFSSSLSYSRFAAKSVPPTYRTQERAFEGPPTRTPYGHLAADICATLYSGPLTVLARIEEMEQESDY